VLFSGGKKSADPNDLLETLLFADLKDDLLRVAKLGEEELVTLVYKQRNIAFPRSDRGSRNLVDWSPRKSKWRGLVYCTG
jgi:hypothetical protein